MSEHVLLLTGAPGIGKTAVIHRVAERLRGRRLGGFYTEEIRTEGQRQGFRLATFDGREIVMAHRNHPKTYQIGRYGVDVAAIDAVVGQALRLDEDVDVYLVDEIGKMECLSSRFITSMRTLLDRKKLVVATIALRGSGFIAEVKRNQNAQLWGVTHMNRDKLPAKVIGWLGKILTPET